MANTTTTTTTTTKETGSVPKKAGMISPDKLITFTVEIHQFQLQSTLYTTKSTTIQQQIFLTSMVNSPACHHSPFTTIKVVKQI